MKNVESRCLNCPVCNVLCEYDSVMHFSHVIFLYLADLIFLIYLYQRWAYPVDKTRVNEFGFGGEDDQASSGEVTPAKEEEKKTN